MWDFNHPEHRILDHGQPRFATLAASNGGGTAVLEKTEVDGAGNGAGNYGSEDPDR